MHADLGQKPYFDVPEPKHLFIEMPWTAIHNNTSLHAGSILKPMVRSSDLSFLISKKGAQHIGSIPTSKLLRGAQVVATPEGFVFLCFENRPSNTYAIFIGSQTKKMYEIWADTTDLHSGLSNATFLPNVRYAIHQRPY